MLNILRNTNYIFVLPSFAGISAIRYVLYSLLSLPDGQPTPTKNKNENEKREKQYYNMHNHTYNTKHLHRRQETIF